MANAKAGNLYYLRYHDIKTILNAFFYEKISHFESVEVQMTFQNGYSYSKHLMNENEGYYPLDFPIMQTGKFIGDFPIKVKIIGKKQMETVDTTFVLNESDMIAGNYKIVTSWFGKNINDLLDYSYDPLTVSSIIDMSIEQNILTPYTGFIVIDKSLSNPTNNEEDPDGEDYNEGDDEISAIDDDPKDIFSLELLAYPNPFNSTVNLKVILPVSNNYTLTIYNILGQKIKEFDLSSFSEGAHILQWSGRSDDNNLVSSGFYFAVLRGNNIQKVVKLQLVE
jgi:hypothetical protein